MRPRLRVHIGPLEADPMHLCEVCGHLVSVAARVRLEGSRIGTHPGPGTVVCASCARAIWKACDAGQSTRVEVAVGMLELLWPFSAWRKGGG